MVTILLYLLKNQIGIDFLGNVSYCVYDISLIQIYIFLPYLMNFGQKQLFFS